MSVFSMSPPSSGGPYELPPAGNFPAVLVGLIDLGTHTSTFGGESKSQRKLALVWEIAAEDEDGVVKHVIMAERYTASLNEKAKLRPVVGAIRGKPLGDDEGCNLGDLLGCACMVEIVHNDVGDKTYGNIGTVSVLPKAMRAATLKPSHEPILWEIGCGKPAPDASWLPRIYGQTIRDILNTSQELHGQFPGNSKGKEEIPF